MALPIIANTMRAAVQGTCPSGQIWVNALHFTHQGGPASPSDITALHAKIQKLYLGPTYSGGDFVMHLATSAVTTSQVTYTPLDGSGLSTILALAGTGTQAGNSLPSETTCCVSLRTNSRGRSYRGRVYLPPMGVSQVGANGNWNATGPNVLVVASMNSFLADCQTISWFWCVASYLRSVATYIVQVTADVKPDVQRGRK